MPNWKRLELERHREDRQLSPIEIPKPPFPAGAAKPGRWSKRAPGSERWVEPQLVAEVPFAEWTPDGQIRHASYVSLRSDKPAATIVRETAKPFGDAGPVKTAGKAAAGRIKLSKATIKVDFAYDGGGPGKGGVASLSVSGQKVAEGRIEKTIPFIISPDEGADVGEDDDTPVSEDYGAGIKSRFTGKIEKVTLEVR